MAEQSKTSVPSTIGGSSNGGGNNANNNNNVNGNGTGRRGNGRRGKGNGNGQRTAGVQDNTAYTDRGAFKDDDAGDLGVMYKHYFDCYSIADQVRFNNTLEKLQQYVGEKCTNFGGEISAGIADISKRPKIEMVRMPQKMTDTGQMVDMTWDELGHAERMILEQRIKMCLQWEFDLKKEVTVLYNFIFRRCTTLLQDRLRAHPRFKDIHASSDPFKLLELIRETVYKTEDTTFTPLSIIQQQKALLAAEQGNMSVPKFHAQFKSMLEALSSQGGAISVNPGVDLMAAKALYPNVPADALTMAQLRDVRSLAQGQYEGTLFLTLADPTRFGDLLLKLKDDYIHGINNFPTSLQGAVNMMQAYESNRPKQRRTGPQNPQKAPAIKDGAKPASTDNPSSSHDGTSLYNDAAAPGTSTTTTGAVDDNSSSISTKKESGKNKTKTGSTSVHFAELPSYTQGNEPELYNGFAFAQYDALISDTWILLDNQSTVDIFCNPDLLYDIHEVDVPLTVHSTGGPRVVTQMGTLRNYGLVWYCPDGIANIISMSNAEHLGFDVSYSSASGAFLVTNPKTGTDRVFTRSDRGLFYSDVAAPAGTDVSLVTTVDDKRSKYSKADYSRAEQARILQKSLMFPASKDLKSWLDKNIIRDCKLGRRDVSAADDVFGPDTAILQGKTTRKKASNDPIRLAPVPPSILKRYHAVTLCVDIMFVNRIPFLVSISQHLRFGTIELLPSRTSQDLLTAIHRIAALYASRGFQVSCVHGDPEFESLREDLSMHLECCNEDEHVPEVERYIRTIKERARCAVANCPFRYWPRQLVINLVQSVVFWLNVFPPNNGVHDVLGPRALIAGTLIEYKHCKLPFGEYVHVTEKTDNTLAPRTVGALALRPHPSNNNTHLFLSLTTGRILHRGYQSYTVVPMPEHVIAHIDALGAAADAEAGVYIDATNLDTDYEPLNDVSTNSPDEPLDSDFLPITAAERDWIRVDRQRRVPGVAAGVAGRFNNDDDTGSANSDSSTASTDSDNNDNDDDNDHDEALQNNPFAVLTDEDDDEDDDNGTENDNFEADCDTDSEENEDNTADAGRLHETSDSDSDSELDLDDDDDSAADPTDAEQADDRSVDATMPENRSEDCEDTDDMPPLFERTKTAREMRRIEIDGKNPIIDADSSTGHTTRSTTRNATFAQTTQQPLVINPTTWEEQFGESLGICFTQYTMKKGLKLFGNKGIEAIRKEMQQFEDLDVGEPINPQDLSMEQRERVLEYLMYLKEKRDGRIKGRGCADGRKQRLWTDKRDSSSPTAALESLMITATIDAYEGRDVATVDIPGAFLQTEQDDDEIIHVKLRAEMATLLAEINPQKYKPYLRTEGGKPVVYMKLKKCLYGTLRASLQFWKDLSGVLQEWGFELNEYDKCVANKTIHGKQCTILWHVDDLKISHVEPDVVTMIINQLSDRFGKVSALTATRGKKHDYLGMVLDYSVPGKVSIDMSAYTRQVLADLPDYYNGLDTTPARNDLFSIDTKAPDLASDDADAFHTLVAKLLFLSMRGRPDILTAVAFLCTRVSCPTIQDKAKLRRVIRYLRNWPDLVLTLEADSLSVFKWWVDASFAVHPDMRSHTGASMSLGKGSVVSMSNKQKLNTRSSTEAELVGVDDAMPRILWTRYFLKAQGYDTQPSTLFQDNQSTILLANNGTTSSSKRTRHIDIRYYFITDRVKKNEITIEYCPTKEMIGDFFTKPLQGALFYKLRARVLNLSPDGVLPVSSTFASPQECVGDKVGDYRLPACPHSSEPPPAETPVGCKSSDN
jgi:hypothetical protein